MFRYAHALVARYQARVHAAEITQPLPDQIHAKPTQPPRFDVWKWLNKVVSVSRDYVELLHIVRSLIRASFLFDDRPIDIIVVPNDAPPRAMAEVSPSAVRVTLYKACWTDIENEQYTEFVDNLCHTLRAYTTAAAISGQLSLAVKIRARP